MDNGIRSVLPVCLESRDERELGHFGVSFLERYVAVLDDAPADPYFEDIVGLTFALDPVSLQDAIDLLHAMGFEEAGDNGSYTLRHQTLY